MLRRIVSAFVSVLIFFTTFFRTGSAPEKIKMPELEAGEYGQWVNPFIGTGGIPWACAMLSPCATTPFGMVRLGADTTFAGGFAPFGLGNSGYYYGHNHIWGFSHTRLSGTGARDMGHFRITPAVGNTDPATRIKSPLLYSHKQEEATAGYYAVNLPTINCLAEMTSDVHTGLHRYTFRTGEDAHIFIDATSFLQGGHATNGKINVLPEANEVEGQGTVFTTFTGRYGGLTGYFVARFSTPFESFSTWSDGESVENRAQAAADDCGVNINFGNIEDAPVEIKVGISFVSIENARENLDAEAGNLDFEGVRAKTRDSWDEWLSRIKIESPDSEIKTVFYTALYHSMIMPTDFTDVDGKYLGFSKTTGTAENYTYRTDMSLWDSFRTEHPLLNLIAPEVQRDCLISLVEMAKIGGKLPRWPSGGGYTSSMFGTSANMVIAESYLKGITDFDVETAFSYMKTQALQTTEDDDNRNHLPEYNQYGYCPADLCSIAVSCTLEYAWSDASVSLLARALGKEDDAALFEQRSKSYKKIFNPKTKYFQPRNADGSWDNHFNPNITEFYDAVMIKKYADDYSEGCARHWRWSVPHDTNGLIELFGSKDYFISELNKFMKDASASRAALDPGPGYWQGNQHDIHAPYLFNDAGAPELTQKWVRWSLAERHSTDVDGLDGNDDGGTLSAWYIFSAMGLYPVAGTDRYWIGSPNLDKAVINMGSGKTLTVTAANQSSKNIYVQSVTLNGIRLTEPSIVHSQIANGGTLEFVMGSEPAANGGF